MEFGLTPQQLNIVKAWRSKILAETNKKAAEEAFSFIFTPTYRCTIIQVKFSYDGQESVLDLTDFNEWDKIDMDIFDDSSE